MEQTPKDIFTDEILIAVGKFEDQTGVEIHGVSFPNRLSDREMCTKYEKTIITDVKFELK